MHGGFISEQTGSTCVHTGNAPAWGQRIWSEQWYASAGWLCVCGFCAPVCADSAPVAKDYTSSRVCWPGAWSHCRQYICWPGLHFWRGTQRFRVLTSHLYIQVMAYALYAFYYCTDPCCLVNYCFLLARIKGTKHTSTAKYVSWLFAIKGLRIMPCTIIYKQLTSFIKLIIQKCICKHCLQEYLHKQCDMYKETNQFTRLIDFKS